MTDTHRPGRPAPGAWPPPPAAGAESQPQPQRPEGANLRLALTIALVIGAGVLWGLSVIIVIAALMVMIFLHELGHFVTARRAGMKVTEFFIGFGPRIWSFRRGEVEYGLKAIPAGAYVRIIGMHNLEEVDPADEPRTYRQKSYFSRLSVAVAGSTMHFLIALVLGFVLLVGWGTPANDEGWVVGSLATFPDRPSPAQEAGLQLGDRIVAFDGEAVHTWEELTPLIQQHPGATVTLTVLRDGRTFDVATELERVHPDTGRPVGFLGVGATYPRHPEGVAGATTGTFDLFGQVAKDSVIGLGKVFSPGGISNYVDNLQGDTSDPGGTGGGGGGGSGDERLLSPVGAVQLGGQLADAGIAPLLAFMIAVNIFVGIFNLIPLLPFDGGHVAIATYEAIRSRKGKRYFADVTKMLPVTYGVVLILGLLFIGNLYLDIARPIGG
jgi:membrane-associated protease RseP (regulator of RpoE activity)